jgi:hypothetical protein
MVSLRFCPSKVGAASSTITIASNATSSNTMSIMATGRGVPYSPGVGSNYTYQAIRLDSAGKPTGAGFLRSTNVIATGLSYNGKSGVTQVNDGNDSYFKIEDDGDVSSYSKGHQTVDSVTFFGATWWKLPFSTRGQNVSLFNDSTTFTSGSGQVGLRVTASASYKGDTILKRGGRSVTVEMVDVSDIATYSATQGRLILVSYMGLFFDPSIGFIARQGVVTDSYTIVGATVKLQGGGEYRDLKSFYLK